MALRQLKVAGVLATTIGALSVLFPVLIAYAYARNLDSSLPYHQIPLLSPSRHSINESEIAFKLRHVFHHGGSDYPNLARRLDIGPNAEILMSVEGSGNILRAPPTYKVRSQDIRVQRLADRRPERMHYLLDAKREYGQTVALPATSWTIDDVRGPNVTDYQTVLDMAHIAANAYQQSNDSSSWYDIGHGFNYTDDFGWETDGIRGHVFVDDVNKTVIIGLKGTTLGLFGTSRRDKENDNLFFGCCCGQDVSWYTAACDCQTSAYTCNSTCLAQALRKKHHYYYRALDLYQNVTEIYPQAEIWMVGHSLGGALSSLVGATFGRPVVTFEAPGDAMAAKRLGLPTPPGYRIGDDEPEHGTGAFHFGHTADTLFLGTCTSAPCTWFGYAMQSVCHTGHECVYNTTRDKGWSPSITHHGIATVIQDVIQSYEKPAQCKVVRDCTDCYKWKYKESNSSESTTIKSSHTRFTQTRTETCKTPGWWGCLDEPSKTTITTTTTCHTPGWFGCKDPVTTTTHTPDSSTMTLSSTSCKSPGWFGCNDPASSSVPKYNAGHFLDSIAGVDSPINSKHDLSPVETCYRYEANQEDRKNVRPGASAKTSFPTATAIQGIR